MNRFAELLDRLAYEPGRNNKLRLITAYFRDTPDPDRGYALAALTGALSFKHAKPGLIRDLITDRTDPVLFGLSYDYVGDLSETVALMWPKSSPSPACGGGSGWGSGRLLGREKEPPPGSSDSARALPDDPTSPASGRGKEPPWPVSSLHNNPPPPTLSEVVTTLRTLGKTELPKQLARWLDELDETGRWALLKLVTGAMRIGISARLAKTAAAALGDKDPHEIELIWPGLSPPYLDLFAWLEGRGRQTRQPRSRAVPPGDAGACDRGYGFRQSRSRRLHCGMEMGRHSRAGGFGPRRTRAHAGAALFAHRRGHHQRAFPTSCRRCICPAPSTASYWCCARAACRPSTCCSSG